jgi:hypothetical protein
VQAEGHERDLNPLEGKEDFGDAREYARHYHEKIGIHTADEIKRICRFYQEFQVWLDVTGEC